MWQAAQLSSPHRVSDGQRSTRQLPKVKTRVSGGIVQQFVSATLFFPDPRAVAPLICLALAQNRDYSHVCRLTRIEGAKLVLTPDNIRCFTSHGKYRNK
jgi:hypothetical protein